MDKNIPFVKIALTVFLLAAFLFVQTFFYKILILAIALAVWRKYINRLCQWRYASLSMAALCLVGLWMTSPKMRWNTDDRVRLIYQDPNYDPMNMPVGHWFANTLMPEAELINFGVPVVKYGGSSIRKIFSGTAGIGNGLMRQFEDCHLSWPGFMKPFRNLEKNGQFVGSAALPQLLNGRNGQNRAVYVISPKNWDKEKTYPVVVNLHGYLGNWQFYQGLLMNLEDYVIISPGTQDLKGQWSQQDLQDILKHQLAFLERLGYKIDRNRVHLLGVSNGAYYGCSSAVAMGGNGFRTVTFCVGSNTSGLHHKGEMHIYGHDDDACPGSIARNEGRCSTDKYIYYPCCGHYVLAAHPEEIMSWLNERWTSADNISIASPLR